MTDANKIEQLRAALSALVNAVQPYGFKTRELERHYRKPISDAKKVLKDTKP